MSFSTQAIGGAKENLLITIPATDSVGGSANATPDTDLTGAVGATLFWAEIDLRNNPNENGVLRLYSQAGTPSGSGPDDSEVTLRGIRGKVTKYEFPVGIIFASKIHATFTAGLGATFAGTDPTGTVIVKLGLNDNV